MPQTVLELGRLIRHTLGGDDPPSEVPVIGLINEAGEHLVSMRRWNWLRRPDTPLNLVASQNYVTLPTDFGEIVAVERTSTLLGLMIRSSGAEILRLRALVAPPTPLTFWWTLDYLGSAALAAPTPRMELYPTPSSSTANALMLSYRAGWTKLQADSDVAVVPSWCDSLLRQLVMSMARGYVEEDVAGLDERLNVIQQGAIFLNAIRRDAVLQPNLGQLLGGAVQAMPSKNWLPVNPDTAIPGPSPV